MSPPLQNLQLFPLWKRYPRLRWAEKQAWIKEQILYEEENPEKYGPENDWFHAFEDDVQEPASCGYSSGDTVCNFTMVDQHGDDVELYQFWGKVIVMDVFSET